MKDSIQVILVDPIDESREAIQRLFASVSNVWLAQACDRYEGMAKRIAELSPDLVRVAEANAVKAARSTRFLCADARTYDLPPGRNLVYLFNPFDAPTLRAFLARNAAHFRESGSVIAYVDDREAAELAVAGFEVLRRWDVPPVSLHRIAT